MRFSRRADGAGFRARSPVVEIDRRSSSYQLTRGTVDDNNSGGDGSGSNRGSDGGSSGNLSSRSAGCSITHHQTVLHSETRCR